MTAIAVIGSGGREDAIARRLRADGGNTVFVVPGGDFIHGSKPTIPDGCELIVVGPEAPLVAGMADGWRRKGVPVFGPGADGAQLEGSKIFMKRILSDAGVRTAEFTTYEGPNDLEPAREFIRLYEGRVAIKTDGLAGGKGVTVTSNVEEALADFDAKRSGAAFGEAGKRLVIERALDFGDPKAYELSLIVVTNGRDHALLPPARDYKRLDMRPGAPMTGGMGAFSPVTVGDDQTASNAYFRKLAEEFVPPVLAELCERGIDYRGVLYFGLMITQEGAFVLEINIRLGDPEAQVILPRIGRSLTEIFMAAARGDHLISVDNYPKACVCVVVAAAGYPTDPQTGATIHGLDAAESMEGVTVIHAGTQRGENGEVLVKGGRALNVVAVGATVKEARDRANMAALSIVDQSPGLIIHTGIAMDA